MKHLLPSLERFLFLVLVLFLPSQFGKHFWPEFSYVAGMRIDYLSPTLYFTDILILSIFALWLYGVLKNFPPQNLKLKSKNIKNLILPLVFILVLSFIFLNSLLLGRFQGTLYSWFKLAEMSFVGYYTAKFIHKKSMLGKAIFMLVIGVLFQSVLALCQFLNQSSLGGVLYFLGERSFNSSTPGIANVSLNGELMLRPYGTLPHPNVLAGYLLVSMILILFSVPFRSFPGDLRSNKQALKSAGKLSQFIRRNFIFIIQALALTLGSSALFISMSRIAILLWILIAVYSLLITFKSKLPSVALVIISVLLLLSPLGARFTTTSASDEAITQRTILTEASFKMLKSNPLIGMGLGNFIPKLAEIQKPLTSGTYLQPVHNIFFLVAVETGLIGLLLFVWFLWKTYRVADGKWQMANGTFIAFLAILITGFFDHYWLTLQQGQLLFAVTIGLCWAKFKLE
jgi:O-antigen ligase